MSIRPAYLRRHRAESRLFYRLRVAFVHTELPDWLALIAVGVWMGWLLCEAAT